MSFRFGAGDVGFAEIDGFEGVGGDDASIVRGEVREDGGVGESELRLGEAGNLFGGEDRKTGVGFEARSEFGICGEERTVDAGALPDVGEVEGVPAGVADGEVFGGGN